MTNENAPSITNHLNQIQNSITRDLLLEDTTNEVRISKEKVKNTELQGALLKMEQREIERH
jgi:hypothetical protein